MRALYCASDDGTNIPLGREAIPDRTNPKPVDDTLINTHYAWRIIPALLNLPSARIRHIIAPHDGNTFHQPIPWTVVLSTSRIYGPYCIVHNTCLMPCECGPICYSTHSSSLAPSPYYLIVYHVESFIHAHTPSSHCPTPLSCITFYVVIFGPFVFFLDRHRVVAWRMDCFGALQVRVVCEVRRVKYFRPRR